MMLYTIFWNTDAHSAHAGFALLVTKSGTSGRGRGGLEGERIFQVGKIP